MDKISYDEIYNSLVDPDKDKRIKIVIKKDMNKVSGNGEALLQDVDRLRENIISMTIYGKSEQDIKFDLVPSVENPLPIISKIENDIEINSIDDYKDYIYKNNVLEKNIYKGMFNGDDKWEVYSLENDNGMIVYTLKKNLDYLDYDIDYEFNIDNFNENLPIANSKVICSHFENVNDVSKEGIWIDNDNNLFLRIKISRLKFGLNKLPKKFPFKFETSYNSQSLNYFFEKNNVEYMYVLNSPKNINILNNKSNIINILSGENVNILFDCDVHIDDGDIEINRENINITQNEEMVKHDLDKFKLPIKL